MRKLIAVLVVAALIAVLPFASSLLYGEIFSGTNVSFQSSDGNWADREIKFKGREFEEIAELFQMYKKRCNAPDATLERTTPSPVRDLPGSWFNDYSRPKWQVPYHAPRRTEPIYYPRCYYNGAP